MSDGPLAEPPPDHCLLAEQECLDNLLQRATSGSDRAREELVAMYRPLIRLVADRYGRRVFKARYDESDVVQITLLEAFTSFPAFKGNTTAEFTRWLEVILERTILRLWREHIAKKRDIRRELSMQELSSVLSLAWTSHRERGPQTRVIAGEQAIIVAQVLQSLPDNYRQAIELRFIEGFKLREIAEQMETSVGSVAGYLRRGLEEMDQRLPSGVHSIERGRR